MDAGYLIDTARGRERLAIVFWYYSVLGQLGVVFLLAAAWALIDYSLSGPLKIAAGVLIAVPVILYESWVLVSLWTCAFNVETKFWAYAVRAYVALILVGYVEGAYEASRWVTERVA